ncbi:PREDICTED: uncharacterized protein LOC106105434 [Papilio polytes]|uniref:uncharacterized protein LOC106105434 n=1 Tax=Papilio polytes TaxID=76194 RepID=UPI0006765F5E|nr:PREDICTED: uncharacterized protein LOC106105434 [Papilio polytes]
MKVLLLLLHLNLLNFAVSFVIRKTTIYHPIPTGTVNNLEQQSSNYAAGDIKFTFLANNHYTRGDEVPSIGNLIKSIRIPGFNVYRIVFNRDNTGNYDNVKSSPKLISKPIPDNYADKQLSKSVIEKRNHSEAHNIDEINKAPDIENVVDPKLIEIDCEGKNSIDKENCKEETTTNINEITTDIDRSNENSTVTSEYDDENYGGISDRSDIPPGLLASLVG